MTNEELAIKIQEGHSEHIPQLWEQVSRFIDMQAGKYLDSFPEHYRALRGDMVNEAYFTFVEAIDSYNPEKGKFTTWLPWHIRNAFATVIMGGRSKREQNEPLNAAVSLDTPISDTEDITLADTLLDETSEAYYRRLEDMDFWRSVNIFINKAIGHIKNEKGREIVRYMFDNNCSIKAASQALYGNTPVQYGQYSVAIGQLRRYIEYSTVKKHMANIGLDDYVYGWGTRAWKNHRFTSAVELVAIKRADRDLLYNDIRDCTI